MFGENMMLGKEEKRVEAKGRVPLSGFSKAEVGDEIAIVYIEIKREIELYSLKAIKDLIIRLDKQIMTTMDNSIRNMLEKRLEELTNSIIETNVVDSQKRILIPNYVRKKEDIKKGSIILLSGKYKNENTYVKCKKIG